MKVLQFLLLIFVFSSVADAQNADKNLNSVKASSEVAVSLKGLTIDELGAAIPHSVVKLISADGNIIQTKANEKAEYEIEVAPGVYKIFAESKINSVPFKAKDIKIEIKNTPETKQDLILYCAGKKKCPQIVTFYCG